MFLFKKKCQIKWCLIRNSFLCAGGVVVYVIIISLIMQKGEEIFGQLNDFTGPVIFLLLFVFSALITGTLVFGPPIWYYLGGSKKEAWQQFFYNILWLFIIIVFIVGTRILMF